MILFVLVFTFLSTAPDANWSSPPAETFERLDSAVSFLESEDFRGTYTITTNMVVAKPNGKVTHQELLVELVSIRHSSESDRRVLQAQRNGADVTEEVTAERQESEQVRTPEDDAEDSHEISVSLTLPNGEELSQYRFEGPWRTGEILVARYAPIGESKQGTGSGRIAWDPQTLDPLWIEFRPTENPKHVKEMSVRFEIARVGDLLYPKRTVTEAVGGFLFIKRHVSAEMIISELTVDPKRKAPGP